MCCLSNLMFGSDENKLLIGQTTGDEITHIIRVHYQDVNLFKVCTILAVAVTLAVY